MTILAGMTLALSAWVLMFISAPRPRISDEFAYLLGADTLLHGRLTNPTHPMYEHFETINVLQQPIYMTKYMPMQSVWLAPGTVLSGNPIIGVYLNGTVK